ncbi:MAG TPA: hypothetical protein VGQ36_12155 [Thermoanaerobaculia bacterium]|jgi:hypothetical protein|nr:hypothetical protein [Thermoanaerobaculia bacterium]
MSSRVHAIAWLAAILTVLMAMKFAALPGDPPYGIDASYYFQIANHVARGHGFVTTVSLYHEGLILPSPSQIYPLWPLLLGYVGRAIGIVRAANLLPPIFYFLSLVLLYVLSRAVALQVGRLRWAERWYVPDAAHLIVALFGVNLSYFGATTHPYTEGLAFTFAFASFAALQRIGTPASAPAGPQASRACVLRGGEDAARPAGEDAGVPMRLVFTRRDVWAFVAGGAAGLAFLGRSQMIAVAVGTVPVLILAAWRNPRLRRGLVAYLATAAAVVIPWIVYLGRIPGLRFAGEWKSVAKIAVPLYFEPGEFGSVLSRFESAASAILHAFSFASDMSYTRTFGPAALLPPIAAVLVLLAMRRRGVRALPADTPIVTHALILAGLFVFVVLVFFPSAFGLRHLFGWRHGLTHVFLLIPAVSYLLGRQRLWTWTTAAILILSIALGGSTVLASVVHSVPLTLRTSERAAVSWLARRQPVPKVLTTNAQILGSVSDAHYHWTDCNSPGLSTRGMVERLKIDYVLVYEGEKRCAFVDGVFDYLKVVQVFEDSRLRVYLLAPR